MQSWITQSLTESTDYAFLRVSLDGVIEEWQGAAQRLFGHAPEEAVGQPFSIIFTPEDVARGLDSQEMALALSAGRSEDDRWHLKKDGSRFWASGMLRAIRGDTGQNLFLCKILRDKTDVRTQIEALIHERDAGGARLAQQASFIAATAHEMRNPMEPIAMALALLKRRDAAGFTEKALNILENQVGVLKKLVDDLCTTVEVTSADVQLVFESVNVNEALRAAVDGFATSTTRQTQQLRLVVPATDIHIEADAARLQQMLLNLIGNAIKYTPAEGHIVVSASVEADMAIIRVEDDGRGISAEILPHIFELFTRGPAAGVDGLGVGLAVVQNLANLHAGVVEARSAGPGKGSVFGLRLPLRQKLRTPVTLTFPGSRKAQ